MSGSQEKRFGGARQDAVDAARRRRTRIFDSAEGPVASLPNAEIAAANEAIRTAISSGGLTGFDPLRSLADGANAPMRRAVEAANAPMRRAVEAANAPTRRTVEAANAPMRRAVEAANAPTRRAVEDANAPLRRLTEDTNAPLRNLANGPKRKR